MAEIETFNVRANRTGTRYVKGDVGSKTTYDNYIKTCDLKVELPFLNCL